MSSIALSLVFVVFAQILNALIVLIDKHIVTKTVVSNPGVYAFYVGSLSGVALFVAPFGGVHMPDGYTIFLSVAMGISFIASIVLLYNALKITATTDVVPWLVAISTVATFLLGSIFLMEDLPKSFIPALTFFVTGVLFVGHFRFNAKSFFFIACSGILFGLSAILLKILFSHTSFIDGFFWSRMGNVFGALLLFLLPSCRRGVLHSSKNMTQRAGFLIIFNRILGGLAFLLVVYAISIGSVSLINALSSLQFLFLFVLIFLMRKAMPEQFGHEFRPGHVAHKIFSMLFILVGFFVLFL